MADLGMIMAKLEDQDKKLEKIEGAIIQLAVQDNQIVTLQAQVNALFAKYDEQNKPDGLLYTIRQEQAVIGAQQKNCQITSIGTQVKFIWGSIVALALSTIVRAIM